MPNPVRGRYLFFVSLDKYSVENLNNRLNLSGLKSLWVQSSEQDNTGVSVELDYRSRYYGRNLCTILLWVIMMCYRLINYYILYYSITRRRQMGLTRRQHCFTINNSVSIDTARFLHGRFLLASGGSGYLSGPYTIDMIDNTGIVNITVNTDLFLIDRSTLHDQYF